MLDDAARAQASPSRSRISGTNSAANSTFRSRPPTGIRAPAPPAPSGSGGGSEGAVEAPVDDLAPALPAPVVRVVVCAVRGPSPANHSAPQTWGRFGRGAEPPPRSLSAAHQ